MFSILLLPFQFIPPLSILFMLMFLWIWFPSSPSMTGGFILHCTSALSEILSLSRKASCALFASLALPLSLYLALPRPHHPLFLTTCWRNSAFYWVRPAVNAVHHRCHNPLGRRGESLFPPVLLRHWAIMQRSVIEFWCGFFCFLLKDRVSQTASLRRREVISIIPYSHLVLVCRRM